MPELALPVHIPWGRGAEVSALYEHGHGHLPRYICGTKFQAHPLDLSLDQGFNHAIPRHTPPFAESRLTQVRHSQAILRQCNLVMYILHGRHP